MPLSAALAIPLYCIARGAWSARCPLLILALPIGTGPRFHRLR